MKSEMTRAWIVESFLPTHIWRCASDIILAEIENHNRQEEPVIRSHFHSQLAVSGSAISEFWADSTRELKPEFVDVLLHCGNPDLRKAILMEVKYNIHPASDEVTRQCKSINRHAISKAIQQIESSRAILMDSSSLLAEHYPAYIMIPEKYCAMHYAYFKDLARGRQTRIPPFTQITSFTRIQIQGLS